MAAERFWELVLVLMALTAAKMWKVMTDSLYAPHRGAPISSIQMEPNVEGGSAIS